MRLFLDESVVSFVTVETKTTNADNTTRVDVAQLKDKKGNSVQKATDLITGDEYVKIASTLPDESTDASTEERKAILSQKPIHYVSRSENAQFTGYWVPAAEPAE